MNKRQAFDAHGVVDEDLFTFGEGVWEVFDEWYGDKSYRELDFVQRIFEAAARQVAETQRGWIDMSAAAEIQKNGSVSAETGRMYAFGYGVALHTDPDANTTA